MASSVFEGGRCLLRGAELECEFDKHYTYECQECFIEESTEHPKFQTMNSLKVHWTEIHSQPAKLVAKCCGGIISGRRAFIDHLGYHHQQSGKSCSECDQEFPSAVHLRKHVKEKHIRTEFYCEACSIYFESQEKLSSHKLRAHKACLHTCEICSKKYPTRVSLRQHMALHRTKSEECPVCFKVFNGTRNLKAHIDNVHSEKFKCMECPYSTGTIQQFNRHMESHKPKDRDRRETEIHQEGTMKEMVKLSTTPSKFLCGPCDKLFPTDKELQDHFQEKHTEQMVSCPDCGKTLASRNNLRLHILGVHKKVLLECDKCTFTTSQQRCLQNHMKNKHAESYPCNYCNLVFAEAVSLRRHQRTDHLEMFICNICDVQNSSVAVLKKHMREAHDLIFSEIQETILSEEESIHNPLEDENEKEILQETVIKDEGTENLEEIEELEEYLDEEEIVEELLEEDLIEEEEDDHYELLAEYESSADEEVPEVDNAVDMNASIIKQESVKEEIEESSEPETLVNQEDSRGKSRRELLIELTNKFCTFRCESCLDDQDAEALKLSSYEEMEEHFVKNHPIEELYGFCCEKRFTQKGLLLHMKSHRVSNQCPICHISLVNGSVLKRHLKEVHQTMPKEESASLMQEYDKLFQYKCEDCPQLLLRSFAEMRIHMADEHNSMGYVFCCGQRVSRQLCKAHLGFHLTPEKYQCQKCLLVFLSSPSLGRHVKNEECQPPAGEEGVDTKEQSTKIRQLKRATERPKKKESEKSYSELFKFHCESCFDDKGLFLAFESYAVMREHFKGMHSSPGYGFCCGKRWRTYDFKDHLEYHRNPGKFTCPECGKSFMKRSILDVHIRGMHKGTFKRRSDTERRMCGLCKVKFQTYEEFLRHRREKHLPAVTCDFCGKVSANIRVLRHHIKECHGGVELGEKEGGGEGEEGEGETEGRRREWTCEHCKKVCRTKEALRLHVRNKHTNKDLECPKCEYKTKFKGSLKLHLQKHQGIVEDPEKVSDGSVDQRRRKSKRKVAVKEEVMLSEDEDEIE